MHRVALGRAAAAALVSMVAQGRSAQTPAKGESYPDRTVRLIVPLPPGGGADLVSRTVLPAWTALMGEQIAVDNRGGTGSE